MKYEDMLYLPRPESLHPKMRREDRAKLFAPFAALSGHDAAVHSRERVLTPKMIPSGETQAELDEALRQLRKGDTVTVVYFRPVAGELGEYATLTDTVVRLEPTEGKLFLRSGAVAFSALALCRRVE